VGGSACFLYRRSQHASSGRRSLALFALPDDRDCEVPLGEGCRGE
jgi:hypothetical protein